MKTIDWDGKQISKPGMYDKIPLALYHSGNICDGPSVSSSSLRRLISWSPAHFYMNWPGNPNCVEAPGRESLILGSAVHHLILRQGSFEKLFCVQPAEYPDEKTGQLKKWTYASTYCKTWRDIQTSEGRLILTQENIAAIRGMANTLSSHPIVKAGALNGLIERSLFWKDKATGLWIKSRPDAIPSSSRDFVDLKTTRSVRWLDLLRSYSEYGYHQQGALVRQAAREVLGIKDATFSLVFVESTPPHCVRVVTLKDGDLDVGEKQNRLALDTIARCLASGHWPGPGGEREDAEHIEMSERERERIDEQLEYGLS